MQMAWLGFNQHRDRPMHATQVLELPSMLAYPLFSKLVEPGAASVPREVLEAWLDRNRALQASLLSLCTSAV